MSKENSFDPYTGPFPDEQPVMNETNPTGQADIPAEDPFDLSLELAEILATFSSPETELEEKLTDTKTEPNPDGVQNTATNYSTENTDKQEKRTSAPGDSISRDRYRHPLHWRVAIVNQGSGNKEVYHGRTHDLSLHGVSILLERNISFTAEVVILLAIPAMNIGHKETLVEIQCSTEYTLLDSEHSQFRLEMKFVHFKGDGKRILSDILSKRHIPKVELNPYAALKI